MRPKISRIDFDVTERENSEVWSGPPEPAVEFHAGFEERTALDEQAILHELSDELREDVMQFLLPGPFRECDLFERQNSAIVLRFADSIQPVASHAGEVVQTTGDTGDLMYVLASGTAAATRDFTGPGDSGLLAGADDAEKAPKKRHSLKRRQSQVSKSKKRMSAKLNGLDATFTPPTKRPTRPSMRRGRVERTMERSDCFGELVALAVHSVYHATLTSTSPAGFFATSQIQIYRNLSEFGGLAGVNAKLARLESRE
ncbi:voltage-gated potassium channel [Aureococcus anophagefferens]|nr:voltage-gated potassium channel [Aureococcus anophagefferens]